MSGFGVCKCCKTDNLPLSFANLTKGAMSLTGGGGQVMEDKSVSKGSEISSVFLFYIGTILEP